MVNTYKLLSPCINWVAVTTLHGPAHRFLAAKYQAQNGQPELTARIDSQNPQPELTARIDSQEGVLQPDTKSTV